MRHITINRSKSAATLVLLLASLTLAACGSSSSGSSSTSTTTTASASKSTSTTGGAAAAARGGRFTALRECLQKDGITLPKRTPGQGRPPGGPGGFLGGGAAGPALPKGVTLAQYEAALKKCGGFTGRGPRTSSPAFKAALTKFAACMRENGIKLPEPNTSGAGPVFDTKGVSTTSAQFRAADTKCAGDLRETFRGAPSRVGGAPPTAG